MTNWSDYYADVPPSGNYDHIAVSDTATIKSGWVYALVTRQIYAFQYRLCHSDSHERSHRGV